MVRAPLPVSLLLCACLGLPGAVPGDTAAPPPEAAPPPASVPVVPGPSSHLFELGWTDAGFVTAALGLQAWAQVRYYDMEAATPSQLDRDDLWAIDRWAAGAWSEEAALASDILIFPLVAAPMAISALDARRSAYGWTPFVAELLLYSEALALSSALNLLVRSTRIHPRPFNYGTRAPESERAKGEASGSFYSGHANASFLAATYLAYTHGLRQPGSPHAALIWVGALGYATAVSGLRVAAGKHFPSDILMGAAAGGFFGWLFPRLHLRSGTAGGKPAPGAASWRLLPAADGGVQALLIKRF